MTDTVGKWIKKKIKDNGWKISIGADHFIKDLPARFRKDDIKGDRESINAALGYLCKTGYLIRVRRGRYDLCKPHREAWAQHFERRESKPSPKEIVKKTQTTIKKLLVETMAFHYKRCQKYGFDPIDILVEAESLVLEEKGRSE